MEKVCVFKACGNGKVFRVVKVNGNGLLNEPFYRVYEGRKWLSHVGFYGLQFAVCVAVNLATPNDVELQVKK